VASSVTLLQLRTDARLYADQRPGGSSTFINDTELNRLINLKAKELFDKLVDARGAAYFATEATIAIVAGTSRYDLPANFFELASVTLEWDTRYHELMFPIGSTRMRVTMETPFSIWSRYHKKAYQLRASQLEFLPTPTTDVTCRIQYVPVYTDMSADGDTFDGINGWEKMAAIGVAMEMREIEKRPSSTLAAMYAEQLARIEELKTERDAEAPKQIVDVTKLSARLGWYGSTYDNSFDPTFG
jgi:hypothetical protein